MISKPVSPDDLAFIRFDASEDVPRTLRLAPELGERLFCLAVELLRHSIMLISIRVTGRPPTPDTPFDIWQAIEEGPLGITEQEASQLEALSSEAGGWILVQEDELVFVEKDQWDSLYTRWRAAR